MENEDEKNSPISELVDFSHPDFVFQPKEYHEWRQQGYFITCKSCELQHSVYVGSEKLLVGINDKGQPILKDRKHYEYKK